MAQDQKNKLFDGWNSLSGGQDTGRSPNQIDKNQAYKLKNMVCRGGGGAGVRPPFLAHTLEFDHRNMSYLDSGVFYSVNGVPEQSVANFHTGKFQEASFFAPRGTPACIMAIVGGRLYRIIPNQTTGFKVAEIQLPSRNRSTTDKAYMYQADRFHITQDGEARPIIFDGVLAKRADDGQIPVGTFGAYGMGRIAQVVHGREISFGDLYGSHDGSEGKKNFTDPGESVLEFSETTFLNEGFNASIAFPLGAITGVHFAPQQDSAVGDGELLAFSETGVSSFFLSQPRENWKDSAFQRVTLLNIGGRSHDMIVSFNGDLWFRSDDGWRSYRQARAEIQGWAHLPMSTEIRDYMESDTPTLLKFGSAINFNNRLIATCTPRSNQGRVFHDGLNSLDFDVLSTFGNATRPAWDGKWSKLKFMKLVTGKFNSVNRAFAFAIDSNGDNQIYEIAAQAGGEDFDGPISWEMQMRSMDCNSPFNEKSILGGDVWVDDVTDEAVVAVSYKSDQEPDWQPWKTLSAVTATGECQAIGCGGVPTRRKGYKPRHRLGIPPTVCNEQTGRTGKLFFECQPRLVGTGYCTIKRFRLMATDLVEDGRGVC